MADQNKTLKCVSSEASRKGFNDADKLVQTLNTKSSRQNLPQLHLFHMPAFRY